MTRILFDIDINPVRENVILPNIALFDTLFDNHKNWQTETVGIPESLLREIRNIEVVHVRRELLTRWLFIRSMIQKDRTGLHRKILTVFSQGEVDGMFPNVPVHPAYESPTWKDFYEKLTNPVAFFR